MYITSISSFLIKLGYIRVLDIYTLVCIDSDISNINKIYLECYLVVVNLHIYICASFFVIYHRSNGCDHLPKKGKLYPTISHLNDILCLEACVHISLSWNSWLQNFNAFTWFGLSYYYLIILCGTHCSLMLASLYCIFKSLLPN